MVEAMIQAFALGLAAFLALVVLAPDRSGDRSERAIKLVLMALVGVLVAVAVWVCQRSGLNGERQEGRRKTGGPSRIRQMGEKTPGGCRHNGWLSVLPILTE